MPPGLWRRPAGRFANAPFQRISSIEVRDGLIRYKRANGQPGPARWDALKRVTIRTTDAGPWDDDVFSVLELGGEALVIPSDAPGGDALLVELQSLSGFDNAAVIEAMARTDNREFLCWKRSQDQ